MSSSVEQYAVTPRWLSCALMILAAFSLGAAPASTAGCSAAEYRKFDFWIGDWDVFVNDKLAGHNLVTREQDGCLLVEHWTSSGGGPTGTSFNYYDIRDGKWHQLYLDNSGNAGAYPAMSGDLEDGKMVLRTDPATMPLARWTWSVIAPGKVRQMAESSPDKGATWKTTWNSVYVRRTAAQ
jgi:hypothetical protein